MTTNSHSNNSNNNPNINSNTHSNTHSNHSEIVKKRFSEIKEKVIQTNNFTLLTKKDIEIFLNTYRDKIEKLLPENFSSEKLIQQAVNLLNENEELKKCTAESIVSSILIAARLGLSIEKPFESAYVIPYRIKNSDNTYKLVAQFQISYKGYKNIALRNEEILDIYGNAVYEGDYFSYSLGEYSNRKLEHSPKIFTTKEEMLKSKDRPLIYVYAGIKYKDGRDVFIVLDGIEIESLRKRNPFQKDNPSGAWATDYKYMAIAKAIKKLKNELPINDYTISLFSKDEQIVETLEDVEKVGSEVKYIDNNTNNTTNVDNVNVDIETGEVIESKSSDTLQEQTSHKQPNTPPNTQSNVQQTSSNTPPDTLTNTQTKENNLFNKKESLF